MSTIHPTKQTGKFHPVMHLPEDLTVFDFTNGFDFSQVEAAGWGVGRYNEARPHGMYTSDLYEDGRHIHMGVDLWAPAGTPVFAFADGTVYALANNDRNRDYGPTIVTRHEVSKVPLYALHGHLSRASLERFAPGDAIRKGQVLGKLGHAEENGNWPPHLHFQISRERPNGADMPGVVTAEERASAREKFPDPRMILGPIY